MSGKVVISGPASWNRIVLLEHLPDPVPHMQFALGDYETVGGTSAGKALGLAALGREVELFTLMGPDADGERLRGILERVPGLALHVVDGARTERHLNLMTPHGERVSLYLSTPDDAPSSDDARLEAEMEGAAAIVLDLSERSRRMIPDARASGRPVWTDIHDYDGTAEFHRPFIDAAEAIFMNADRIGGDPLPFMRHCIDEGARLVVCTLGAEGAVALSALDGGGASEHRVDAVPVEVVDTNGAGDAFMSGVLHATLNGAGIEEALELGARQAASVLGTRHLHATLDALVTAVE
ncbi:carbohydrate kinase family protein [Agromyces aurantiacus]|uniref:Carbohydrate kinase family protein n=1 Tax=Agromyces aurantiacus TaxID=165814 RepID=A0ABV9R3C2_9MICO|nr:carbohydrate kinase family protein [Agromyces aurantiacus]MBM7502987.1 sugar/nucleoside kinase (ribokinase family) [Agromyces aurantiacus]